MQAREEVLNGHSQTIGRLIYDGGKPIVRAEFINFCDYKENPRDQNQSVTEEELSKSIEMQRMDALDEELKKKRAEEVLEKERQKENMTKSLGKRCRVLPNDRFDLQQLVFKEVFANVYSDFPQGKHKL